MGLRTLLIVTAVVETANGVTLLLSPLLVTQLLLGAPLDEPAALIVARITGLGAARVGRRLLAGARRWREPRRASVARGGAGV